MSIEEQFNLIAKEYDSKRKNFIPCLDDYYQNTTKFIANSILEPKNILDLGAGTGLLTYYWYQQFPNSNYLLVDIADEMLEVAKKRFNNLNNFNYIINDYSKELPKGEFDCIISGLSIHHLTHENKKDLFKRIYDKLPKNGIFVNYDQFCGNTKKITQYFDSYWINNLRKTNLTNIDIEKWEERRKLDIECSVEDELKMIKECNFNDVNCVYLNQKFAVIIAIK